MSDVIDRLIKYLHSWMKITDSTSLGYQFLNIISEFIDEFIEDKDLSTAGRYIRTAKLCTPWLGYKLNLDLSGHNRYTFIRALPYWTYELPKIVTAIDLHDFYSSKEPIAYFDEETNTVFFNNLLVQLVRLAYGVVSGSNTIYSFHTSIMPGTFMRYRQSVSEDWILVEPYDGIDYVGRTLTVPSSSLASPTGAVFVQYSYLPFYPTTPDGSTNIFVSTNETTPIRYQVLKNPIWNYFDDLGLLVAVERLPDEDNYLFQQRIINALRAPGNSTYEGLMSAVGRGLRLATVYEWTGASYLNIGDADFVYVKDLDEIQTVQREEMIQGRLSSTPTSVTYIWYTQKPVYGDSYEVFINGKRYYDAVLVMLGSDTVTPSSIQARSSYIDLSGYQDRDNIQTVDCTYSYRAYLNSDGYLIPYYLDLRSLDNPYYVTTVDNLFIKRLFDSSFISGELMATTPTEKYYYYADQSLNLSPVTLGKALWDQTPWFSKTVPHPQISHLPSNWDILQPQIFGSGADTSEKAKQIWKAGTGGREDLQVRLVKQDDGSIVPILHFGYYFLGDEDPIREHYLYSIQASTPLYLDLPSTPVSIVLPSTPTEGAPIFIEQGAHEVPQYAIDPSRYQEEVHTVIATSGYSPYSLGVPLYFEDVSSVGVLIAIYSGSAFGSWQAPSNYIIRDGMLLFSGSDLSAGDIIKVRYWLSDAFGIVRDSPSNIITGRTLSVKSSLPGTHTAFWEDDWLAATPGLAAYHQVTDFNLNPIQAGTRAGFLFIDNKEPEPFIIYLTSPFSSDVIDNIAATPVLQIRPRHGYSYYNRSTPTDIYYRPVILCARVIDVYENPVAQKEILWSLGATTPTVYSDTTDNNGVSYFVVPEGDVYHTPTVISVSCGSASAYATISTEMESGPVIWQDEIQVNLAVDESEGYPGSYYISAWAHIGGIPITSGQILFWVRTFSATEEKDWQLTAISTTPIGPLPIPTTPSWTVTTLYSPQSADEQIMAGYYRATTTPGYFYSRIATLKYVAGTRPPISGTQAAGNTISTVRLERMPQLVRPVPRMPLGGPRSRIR
jgi:hypothetical protein